MMCNSSTLYMRLFHIFLLILGTYFKMFQSPGEVWRLMKSGEKEKEESEKRKRDAEAAYATAKAIKVETAARRKREAEAILYAQTAKKLNAAARELTAIKRKADVSINIRGVGGSDNYNVGGWVIKKMFTSKV